MEGKQGQINKETLCKNNAVYHYNPSHVLKHTHHKGQGDKEHENLSGATEYPEELGQF